MENPPSPASIPARLQLAPGPWTTLLEGLCARFPWISAMQWQDRFARGRVQDRGGRALAPGDRWRAGQEIVYFREVAHEPVIPFSETILHHDEHLLVADKPHFLPVVPAGRFVRETLLARLQARTGCATLVPLHRIDRDTAGLVLFSTDPATRGPTRRCSASAASTKVTRPWRRRCRTRDFRWNGAAGCSVARRSSVPRKARARPTA